MDENPYRAPEEKGAGSAAGGPPPPISGGDLPAVTWTLAFVEFTTAMLFAVAYVLWRRQS